MQKLKDIFYDTSDILVAVAIIAIAALIIWVRIDAIMAYPTDGAPVEANTSQNAGDTGGTSDIGSAIPTDGAITDDTLTDDGIGTSDSAITGGDEGSSSEINEYSFYVGYRESAMSIADKLMQVGLIQSNAEFYDALTAANAAERLQAGTFIIPVGSTPADIVTILTNSPAYVN